MVEDREYRLIWIIIMTDRVLHYYCVTLSPFDISNVLILSNYFWYFSTPRARVLNPASARSSRAKTSTIQIDCSNVFLLQTLPTWLIYSWEPGDTWDLILAWHSVWIILIIVLVIMSRLPSCLSSLSFSDVDVEWPDHVRRRWFQNHSQWLWPLRDF